MVESVKSDSVTLAISFNANMEPKFIFKGSWNIQYLGHARRMLLREYKHYMRDIRIKEELNDKRIK
jgi:hypothetical protein